VSQENQTVRITGVAKDGAAEKAGLMVGDVMMAIDGESMRTPEDARIALFYKNRGDIVAVKLRRGDQEMELKVSL
jgi:S1-C subfamily serine protease